MSDIIGKWVMEKGQPFPGLWFEFKADGTFQAELPGLLKVVSSGTYTAAEGKIDIDQTKHTMGLVGKFAGLYAIEGDTLQMALSPVPGGPRPTNLSGARIYKRAQ